MTRVLLWTHKYGTEAYAAGTDAELEGAARHILSTLISDGYVYEPDPLDSSEDDLELLALTEEDVAALPSAVRAGAETDWRRLKAEKKRYEDEKEYYDDAVRIARGNAAWYCARERAQHSQEEWARIVEAAEHWHGPTQVRPDGLYRPESAWAILDGRSGYEYELYEVIELQSEIAEDW